MILPCPSAVWIYDERIYFFIQLQRPYEIFYAVADLIGDEWKVQIL